MNNEIHHPPSIAPVPDGIKRPLWSVMIPTYNCAKYLRQTLESVLCQDPGADQMQIEVVDDCSTKDDPEAVVKEVGNGRVGFFRKPQNEGATANFNTCIQRSRGHLVHILHGDDYVLPGFYAKIANMANQHPEVSLLATRSFFVDEAGVIAKVSERLAELENGSHDIRRFLYGTPLQTPSVVVRRHFYENHGGFLPTLVHAADWEMWTRNTKLGGAVVAPEVLSCYRVFAANDSSRLRQTADNLRDLQRLFGLLASRYPEFSMKKARRRMSKLALSQAWAFAENGNRPASKANLRFWRSIATPQLWLHRTALSALRYSSK